MLLPSQQTQEQRSSEDAATCWPTERNSGCTIIYKLNFQSSRCFDLCLFFQSHTRNVSLISFSDLSAYVNSAPSDFRRPLTQKSHDTASLSPRASDTRMDACFSHHTSMSVAFPARTITANVKTVLEMFPSCIDPYCL